MTIPPTDIATLSQTVFAHPGPGHGGPGWVFLLVPLLWLIVVVAVIAIVGRRWRKGGPPWMTARAASPSAAAEGVLAQRFANGDIDEVEYRARLEVLRATRPPVA
jgi:putative membrane protein